MNVFDTAIYILEQTDEITAMKLQKLCYYAQAWSLVWDERPVFNDRIEAWANGPVCPVLFSAHKGIFVVNAGLELFNGRGDGDLDDLAHETIEAVVNAYNKFSAPQLSAMTHREEPWIEARTGMSEEERGNSVITLGAMANYYGNL